MVIAPAKLPIPSRTRPIRAGTPMVLRLKTWESRSPPNLERTLTLKTIPNKYTPIAKAFGNKTAAGWSSPVARQAHNLKAAGSNPAPATKKYKHIKDFKAEQNARLSAFVVYINATSTPQQKNRSGAHKPALAGSGGQLAVARDSGSRHHPPVVL